MTHTALVAPAAMRKTQTVVQPDMAIRILLCLELGWVVCEDGPRCAWKGSRGEWKTEGQGQHVPECVRSAECKCDVRGVDPIFFQIG